MGGRREMPQLPNLHNGYFYDCPPLPRGAKRERVRRTWSVAHPKKSG